MQLRSVAALAIVVAAAGTARADGELTLRGVYYKERSTRVQQPMLDGRFDVGEAGEINAHVLVDAITSASAASGADDSAFSERRYELGASYTHELDTLRLNGNTRFSTEPDYRSIFVGARAEADLFEKNLVIGLGGNIGRDHVTNAGAQDPLAMNAIEGDLTTYIGSASASQILSDRAVVAVTYDLAYLKGFQQNPYRTAISDMGLKMETHPDKRVRHAIAGSARYYIPQTHTAIIAAYRYYRDDWSVHAHTPELRVIQEAGDGVEFGARYRFYTQDAAYFYAERYVGTETLFTDDIKLSAFESHTFEGKLGVAGGVFGLSGRWQDSRIEVLLQYVAQDNRFGNAIVAQAAFTVPFAY
jgi:hypothetical protein